MGSLRQSGLQVYSDGVIDYSESGSCVPGIEKSPYQKRAL